MTGAPLTVTANPQAKVYGATDPKLTYTVTGTFYNGDGPGVVSGVVLSTATGSSATAGMHTITATGGTADNYAITDAPGTLTVSKAPLTVTADDKSKVYGATDPPLTDTPSGSLYYTDTYSVISGVSLTSTLGAEATAGKHSITVTGGTAANYVITDVNGTLTVSKAAALTVTADDKSKVYGASDPPLTYTVTGTFYYDDGPSVVSGVSPSTATGASATVGMHTITVNGMAANYAITDSNGTLTVTKAALIVTADDQSKVYGALDPKLTYTVSGTFYYSDGPGVVSGVVLATATGAEATAGMHDITATGGTAANYLISDGTGTLIVFKAPLTVTADDKSKVYGATDPPLTYTPSGTLYYTDTYSVISGVSLATTLGVEATAGMHTITVTGGTATNYAITDVNGTLTVSKAPLTVTADDKSKVYGATDPPLTYTPSGTLYYTDTYSVISGVSLATTLGVEATAGMHTITATGGTATNYAITDVDGTLTVSKAAALLVTADDKSEVYGAIDPSLMYSVTGKFYYSDGPSVVSVTWLPTPMGAAATVGTYPIVAIGMAANYAISDANGTLTVTKAPLTVTADDQSKVYGGPDPKLTYTVSGTLYYGDGPGVVSGVLLSTATGPEATAGMHTITVTGGKADNYAITDVTGTLTVLKAPLTVTADDKSKVYGATDPPLTYTPSGILYYTDTYSVISGVSLATTLGAGATAGMHTITATGGTALNYAINDVDGTLAVTPASLTITADSVTRIAGQPNPVLTAHYSGFVNGDSPANLTTLPALSTTATSASAAGSYPIVAVGAASPNYAIHYVNGVLTITTGPPAPMPPLTVKAVSLEKVSVVKGKKHKKEEVVVVQFSGGLNPATAQNLGNYTLATVPKGKKKSTRDVLAQAVYNASTSTVTLTPRKQPVVLKPPLQLTIIAAGLTDTSGQEIDGNADGQPGGNYVRILTK